MKYIVFLFFFSFLNASMIAQSEMSFSRQPAFNCYNCQGLNGLKTGVKFGIDFGLVKSLNSRLDIISNLGYGSWRYKVRLESFDGTILDEYKQNNNLVKFSLGERIHLFKFENSSIYTGVNFNFQFYTRRIDKWFGISVEPNIGWRKLVGEKSEVFVAAGFDQHLTSLSRWSKQYPRRVAFTMGYNIILGNKKKAFEEQIVGEK